MDETQNLYLMKHEDGSLFGPVSLDQLYQWAVEAQISPLDKVSTDGKSWIKAPMVAELEMDYLVEVGEDQFYGPTTIGAVKEFVRMGEITADAAVTNCRDGTEQTVRDLPLFRDEQPVRTSIRLSLQQRVRELEESLLEERRAREAAEQRCEKLEARLSGLQAESSY